MGMAWVIMVRCYLRSNIPQTALVATLDTYYFYWDKVFEIRMFTLYNRTFKKSIVNIENVRFGSIGTGFDLHFKFSYVIWSYEVRKPDL
jgi:hypothetical protein